MSEYALWARMKNDFPSLIFKPKLDFNFEIAFLTVMEFHQLHRQNIWFPGGVLHLSPRTNFVKGQVNA